MVDANDVRRFYDRFSTKLLRDYLLPNRRILAQNAFLRDAIAAGTESILIIGCGTGQGAHYIATRIARDARILAVDISGENIAIGQVLFAHPRIEYRVLDAIDDPIPGTWQVVILPDSYEHIPIARRPALHAQLSGALADRGKLLVTCPTPAHQRLLRDRDAGLQIVDEDVTVDDVQTLARDTGGQLTYFAMISVWGACDYMHVQIERGREFERPITPGDRIPIYRSRAQLREYVDLAVGESGLLYWPLRRLRVWWALERSKS